MEREEKNNEFIFRNIIIPIINSKIKHPKKLIVSDTRNYIFCGIYKITSPSGKIYIGQSGNIYQRWYANYRYLKCKGQEKLYNSFKKYGVENHKFEIIHLCEDDVDLLEYWEDYYIDYYKAKDRELGLNLRGAGKHGKMTEESKEKNRQSHLGEKNNFYNRNHTEETKEKIRKSRENTKQTEETRIKISNSLKQKAIEKKSLIIRDNPTIECACGCGKTLYKYNEHWKERKYISGHNPRTAEDIIKQKDTWAKKREAGEISFTVEHRRKLSEAGKKRKITNENTLRAFSKNWAKGPNGRKFKRSEKDKEKARIGWIKRKENKNKEIEQFNNLTTEDKYIVVCLLLISKLIDKRKSKSGRRLHPLISIYKRDVEDKKLKNKILELIKDGYYAKEIAIIMKIKVSFLKNFCSKEKIKLNMPFNRKKPDYRVINKDN